MSANGRAIFGRLPLASSRFEKAVRGLLRGALLGERRLQPFDFACKQRDALGQILDLQQRQILTDLMAHLLARPVVVLDGHVFPRCLFV